MLQGVFHQVSSASRPTDPDTLESSGAALAHVLILKVFRTKNTPLYGGSTTVSCKLNPIRMLARDCTTSYVTARTLRPDHADLWKAWRL
jgi:hypothetical protein